MQQNQDHPEADTIGQHVSPSLVQWRGSILAFSTLFPVAFLYCARFGQAPQTNLLVEASTNSPTSFCRDRNCHDAVGMAVEGVQDFAGVHVAEAHHISLARHEMFAVGQKSNRMGAP